jgi:hypothetical protein
MRPTTFLCGLLVAAGISSLVSAQTPPQVLYYALVNDATAEVISTRGTGPSSFVTNVLKHGDEVQVVSDYGDGWLGIKPPTGSFSWINKGNVIQQFPNYPFTLTVETGSLQEVSVLQGSTIRPEIRGAVEGGKVRRGTQVRALGRPNLKDPEGEWVAIEAPWTEVRYLRADKVRKVDAGQGLSGTQVQGYPPGGSAATVSSTAGPAAMTVADQLWQRALQAERAGRIDEAVQLYSDLASQTTGSQHDLAMQGLNRAYWLRQAQHNPAPSLVSASPAQRGVPAAPASEARYAPTSSNSQFNPNGALDQSGQAVRLVAPSGSAPGGSGQPETRNYTSGAAWQPATPGGYPSSGPGRLRRAGRFLDNRKTYALESAQGYPLLYVTPYQGIDLEPYLNQNVELFGPAIYDGNLRANYMTVVRVQPLQ